MKADVYEKLTARIIADLEQGERPWFKPWNAEHAAGRITRPLRHNGTPYQGINVVMLWSAAVAAGFAAPIWSTYRQAQELGVGWVAPNHRGRLSRRQAPPALHIGGRIGGVERGVQRIGRARHDVAAAHGATALCSFAGGRFMNTNPAISSWSTNCCAASMAMASCAQVGQLGAAGRA